MPTNTGARAVAGWSPWRRLTSRIVVGRRHERGLGQHAEPPVPTSPRSPSAGAARRAETARSPGRRCAGSVAAETPPTEQLALDPLHLAGVPVLKRPVLVVDIELAVGVPSWKTTLTTHPSPYWMWLWVLCA